jgi:hypothetical protein
MQRGIDFICGLPRAGSTLLAGILRQNPPVHAAMYSPFLNSVSLCGCHSHQSVAGEDHSMVFHLA